MSAPSATIDSLVTFRNSQGIEARGTLVRLSRSALVVEVYNPYSIVQLSEVIQDLHIRRGNRVIYRGKGVVSNMVNTGLMLIVSVTLLDPWLDLSGLLNDAHGVHYEVVRFLDDWEASYRLNPGYRLVVGDLRAFLAELNRWLDQVDVLLTRDDHATEPGAELLQEILEPLSPKCLDLFQRFEAEAAAVTDDALITHRTFAQRDLHPFVMRAPFVHRAFTKPLGYAGDYEMVNMMLRNPWEGPSVYSQIVNVLHLMSGPAAAHRNRVDVLQQRLGGVAEQAAAREATARVLNIGCGPAIEVQRFVRSHPEAWRCHLSLLDFNQETLDYTRERVSRGMPASAPTLEYLHESVHSLLKQATRTDPTHVGPGYDYVYCAGLFDYLSDRVCSRLLRLFLQWVKPGGKVLATNVHPRNSKRYWMEHVLEWHLIYRDEQGMLDIAPHSDDATNLLVHVEGTGENIFLEFSRKV